MKLVLIFLLTVGACSFKKKPLSNQVLKGHSQLYSHPEVPEVQDPEKYIRLSVASFNDLEGQLSPLHIEFKDKENKEKQSIKLGGKDVITQYVNILRQNSPHTLLLDSGDIFSPSLTTQEITSFYETLGFDAMTLGTNDFNIKLPEGYQSSPDYFKDFAAHSKTPLILSNIYDLKTARHVEWQGVRPYLLKEVGELKVGIIGIIPDDIVGKTTVDNRLGLFVENMLQSTLRQARLLKSLGANMIVVLTHQNINCGHQLARENKLPLEKVNFEPRNQSLCDLTNILGEYLKRLPPNLVDLVIGGRSEEKAANYVGNTLVLSGFPKGMSFNVADFYFDKKSKQLVSDLTYVYQPVMTCHEFFKETEDCYYKDETVDHKKRIPATFLGVPIEPTPEEVKNTSVKIDYFKALKELNVDLIFNVGKEGNSQILTFEVSGSELIKLLEEEFNLGNAQYWHPNPFLKVDDSVFLLLAGEKIINNKIYKIALDLDSRNASIIFKSRLKNKDISVLHNHSWNDFNFSDKVSSKLSAQVKDTTPQAPGN
ncbi:MAG TPA: hypothetical protein VKY27_05730 [Bacteriovoracaceae bacterium]|nr:hypothetical protein [Bacteriovoracaceae bacterium]